MKSHLMYRDRDFVLEEQPAEELHISQDLELDTLCAAMAAGDNFLFQVARHTLLSSLSPDLETILYRQDVLRDGLCHESVMRELYQTSVEAVESKRKGWFSLLSNYPRGILHGAVGLLDLLLVSLYRLTGISAEHGHAFQSEGFQSLFASIETELDESYLAKIEDHLEELKFRRGVLLSAELGPGNAGTSYLLRKANRKEQGWFTRLIIGDPTAQTFRLADRDEAGARILSDLQDRGLQSVAKITAQSAEHVLGFFKTLRTELAFYIGCLNLHRELTRKRVETCFPSAMAGEDLQHSFSGLRDPALALTSGQDVVGNDLRTDGKSLILVTGANQGGKSVFLRAVGLAQLMMQGGMFVAADTFAANICRGVFTHYLREEDTTMESGKFDEELKRMSKMADALKPGSMVLFNESFAATNEREGSEIAGQIVRALRESGVKVFFVTHLYDFAQQLWQERDERTLFLRAERLPDGRRTFKVQPGEPMQTSFGTDLYEEIFAEAP